MPTKARLLSLIVLLLVTAAAGCSPEQEVVDPAVQETVQAQVIERAVKETVAALQAATEAAQPPTATATPAPAATPEPATATPEAAPEAAATLSADYVPVLAGVDTIECEYDAFRDMDYCVEPIDSKPLSFYAIVDGSIVVVYALVSQAPGQQPQLRWSISYSGSEWLFLQQVVFLYDGQRYFVDFDPATQRAGQVLDGGSVFEGIEVPVESVETLIDIVTAKEVQVRLAGQNGDIDKRVTSHEKDVLLRALATYEKRGGQLPANRDKLVALVPASVPAETPAAAPAETPVEVPAAGPAAAPADPPAAPMTGIVSADAANLRSGPGTTYEVVGQAADGAKLEIVETSADGAWYKLPDGKWIAAMLVSVQGENP